MTVVPISVNGCVVVRVRFAETKILSVLKVIGVWVVLVCYANPKMVVQIREKILTISSHETMVENSTFHKQMKVFLKVVFLSLELLRVVI